MEGAQLRAEAAAGREKRLAALLRAGQHLPTAALDQPDQLGKTALMEAAEKGHLGCVQLLVEYGAALDQTSDFGFSAVMFAAGGGHASVLGCLLRAGALLDLQAYGGLSAVMMAACGGSDLCVRELLEGGANLNLKDEQNRTALHWALIELRRAGKEERQCYENIVNLLSRAAPPIHSLSSLFLPENTMSNKFSHPGKEVTSDKKITASKVGYSLRGIPPPPDPPPMEMAASPTVSVEVMKTVTPTKHDIQDRELDEIELEKEKRAFDEESPSKAVPLVKRHRAKQRCVSPGLSVKEVRRCHSFDKLPTPPPFRRPHLSSTVFGENPPKTSTLPSVLLSYGKHHDISVAKSKSPLSPPRIPTRRNFTDKSTDIIIKHEKNSRDERQENRHEKSQSLLDESTSLSPEKNISQRENSNVSLYSIDRGQQSPTSFSTSPRRSNSIILTIADSDISGSVNRALENLMSDECKVESSAGVEDLSSNLLNSNSGNLFHQQDTSSLESSEKRVSELEIEEKRLMAALQLGGDGTTLEDKCTFSNETPRHVVDVQKEAWEVRAETLEGNVEERAAETKKEKEEHETKKELEEQTPTEKDTLISRRKSQLEIEEKKFLAALQQEGKLTTTVGSTRLSSPNENTVEVEKVLNNKKESIDIVRNEKQTSRESDNESEGSEFDIVWSNDNSVLNDDKDRISKLEAEAKKEVSRKFLPVPKKTSKKPFVAPAGVTFSAALIGNDCDSNSVNNSTNNTSNIFYSDDDTSREDLDNDSMETFSDGQSMNTSKTVISDTNNEIPFIQNSSSGSIDIKTKKSATLVSKSVEYLSFLMDDVTQAQQVSAEESPKVQHKGDCSDDQPSDDQKPANQMSSNSSENSPEFEETIYHKVDCSDNQESADEKSADQPLNNLPTVESSVETPAHLGSANGVVNYSSQEQSSEVSPDLSQEEIQGEDFPGPSIENKKKRRVSFTAHHSIMIYQDDSDDGLESNENSNRTSSPSMIKMKDNKNVNEEENIQKGIPDSPLNGGGDINQLQENENKEESDEDDEDDLFDEDFTGKKEKKVPPPPADMSPSFQLFSADPFQPKYRRKTTCNSKYIFYPYEVLRTSYPEDIDITKKELYLTNDEFCKLFGMTKENYKLLPQWKAKRMKLDLGLF